MPYAVLYEISYRFQELFCRILRGQGSGRSVEKGGLDSPSDRSHAHTRDKCFIPPSGFAMCTQASGLGKVRTNKNSLVLS